MSENYKAKVGIEFEADKSSSSQIAEHLLKDFRTVEQEVSKMSFLDETKIKRHISSITS